MGKAEECRHFEYVFDYEKRIHICQKCKMNWRDTGKSYESDDYVFDRFFGVL